MPRPTGSQFRPLSRLRKRPARAVPQYTWAGLLRSTATHPGDSPPKCASIVQVEARHAAAIALQNFFTQGNRFTYTLTPASDGYGTGFTIFVLRKAGVPAAEPAIARKIAGGSENEIAQTSEPSKGPGATS